MKRTLLLSILAVVPAVLVPLSAAGQENQEAAQAPGQAAAYKYEAYAGIAYTRIRQVTLSYSGLGGGKASLSRNWGKYFQLTGSVDYYKMGLGHSNLQNPGNPSVYTFLVGPGLHADLYGNLSGKIFAEIGGEHTGGENMNPSTSFAGGFGGGLTYSLNRRWAVQLTGDRVGASFPLSTSSSTQNLGYSTHRTWNARGTFGVVYRF